MLNSQCRKNNPREEVAWCTDNFSVILQMFIKDQSVNQFYFETGRPSTCTLRRCIHQKAPLGLFFGENEQYVMADPRWGSRSPCGRGSMVPYPCCHRHNHGWKVGRDQSRGVDVDSLPFPILFPLLLSSLGLYLLPPHRCYIHWFHSPSASIPPRFLNPNTSRLI